MGPVDGAEFDRALQLVVLQRLEREFDAREGLELEEQAGCPFVDLDGDSLASCQAFLDGPVERLPERRAVQIGITLR